MCIKMLFSVIFDVPVAGGRYKVFESNSIM